MRKFDLVIFDCDGVLVDSEAIGNRVLATILARYGVRLSPAEAKSRYIGLAVGEIRADVEASFAVSLPEDWTVDYYSLLISALAKSVQPIEGINSVIESLQHAGIPFCVASQGPLDKIEASLRCAGLWNAFAGRAFSAKGVARPKPAPDLFLHAALACGVDPHRCAVVEDSPTGVTAARAAEMMVFGYCNAGNASEMRELGAVPFASMEELPALLASV